MKTEKLEIRHCIGEGFNPLVDYETWRVASFKYSEQVAHRNASGMSRHNETDEVFVLLQGKCIIFIGYGAETIGPIDAYNMEPLTVYNIKKGTWHSTVLNKDAVVLIVENQNTSAENSPVCSFTVEQIQEIHTKTQKLWLEE